MRSRALIVALALVATTACPGREPVRKAPPASTAAGNRLNVLLVTIDTLRADHLGAYGYPRATSPRIDALAGSGTLFERAYTFWPKTRGSFVALLTGRHPSRSGYSKRHPMLLDHNPTLASVLSGAGYRTAAVVDNPNVAASLGYARGFETYRETWEEKALGTEIDRARAITDEGVRFLSAPPENPFFLWLHYVNPHAPYAPPPPYDTAFVDAGTRSGPALPVVPGLHGGIPRQWAVEGEDRLGWYVAQYDGEIAAVDHEVGQVLDALEASGVAGRTLVVLTSDHGESLGEHDYFFDHGEDLFDPCLRVPFVVRLPGAPAHHRVQAAASTLDLVPTILDALKVSYPPELAGRSLLPLVEDRVESAQRERLYAQNDRNLSAAWDERFKVVATPDGDRLGFALYDREADPAETRDVSRERPEQARQRREQLETFLEAREREWGATRRMLAGSEANAEVSAQACEQLEALGYVGACGGS